MSWLTQSFEIITFDPDVMSWLEATRPAIDNAIADPANRAQWLRHGGAWFAGVDVLPNDAKGRVAGGIVLRCAARALAEATTGPLPLHPAQISVTYPGYPRQDAEESDANHRYRRTRDAAHLDGLLPIGPERRRMVKEPHGYILGLPLTPCRAGEAPLVVWRGSHEVMRRAMREALADHPKERWSDVDVTDAYHTARREVFETCERVEVLAEPGDAILVHRLALHGVAPWTAPETQSAARIIVYFRPELPGGVGDWLQLP